MHPFTIGTEANRHVAAVQTAVDRAHNLSDRREIRAAIAEAEAAERAKAEIGKELARLQLEIDAATEAHTAKCAPIQKQLLDLTIGITERLQLREKIEKHNRELQERVDTLTAAIRTAEAEQAALQPRTAPLLVDRLLKDRRGEPYVDPRTDPDWKGDNPDS